MSENEIQSKPVIKSISVIDERAKEIIYNQKKRFLFNVSVTTTVSNGTITESSAIILPDELKSKEFIVDSLKISGISSTAAAASAGDDLLVGVNIDNKPLITSSKYSLFGATANVQMIAVPLNYYLDTIFIMSRKTKVNLFSDKFINANQLTIIYAHKSTNTVHYLLNIAIGGVFC